jgi:p-aminobenzoyl-glutamate transporter AbgT
MAFIDFYIFIALSILLYIRYSILKKKDKRQGKEVRTPFGLITTIIILALFFYFIVPLIFGLMGGTVDPGDIPSQGFGGTVGPGDIPPVS